MKKVFQNNGRHLIIFSDNDMYFLSAIRRAIRKNWNGIVHYNGSEWHISTFRKHGLKYVPFQFEGIKYIVSQKKEIINMLSRSVQFKQAYAELVKV